MLLAEVLALPVSVKIGGKEVEFARLPLPDYAKLEAALRGHLNACDREHLDECGIAGAERYAFLRDGGASAPTMYKMAVYLESTQGVRKALDPSLRRAGMTDDGEINRIIDSLDIDLANRLAMVVTGLAEVKEKPQRPLTGAGTGEASATSSENNPAATPQS